MNAICLQNKRGIKSAALLEALIDLGVDRIWLIEELRKINSFVDIEKVSHSSYIRLKTGNVKLLSEKDLFLTLEHSHFSEKIKKSVSEIISMTAGLSNKLALGCNEKMTESDELLETLLYATAFMLCMEVLECEMVYTSSLEVDSHADIKIFYILKGSNIRLITEANCTYDYCAAAFIAVIGENKNLVEGKIVGASSGEENGSFINTVLMECENCYDKEIQYIVECNIDDMNSEGYDYIFNRLLSAGALDVYMTPIIMKKGRPAIKLSILAGSEKLEKVKECIFRETSTFGVRSYAVEKSMLDRKFDEISVFGETVNVKYGYFNGKAIKYKPEYEDCKRIAEKKSIGINQVYIEALRNMPPLE